MKTKVVMMLNGVRMNQKREGWAGRAGLTSDHSDISHWGPQAGFLQTLRSSGRAMSADSHRSLYTELSKPGEIIFQQRTMRNWNPSPHVREHSLQLLVSHLVQGLWRQTPLPSSPSSKLFMTSFSGILSRNSDCFLYRQLHTLRVLLSSLQVSLFLLHDW